MWKIIDAGINSAGTNMRRDYELLKSLPSTREPILHLYSWIDDSATYGHFTKPEQHLDLSVCEEKKLKLAKRPTGGGIIFHISDWAFSALVPADHSYFSLNTLENYALINNLVIDAVQKFLGRQYTPSLLEQEPVPRDAACRHFCMAKPTKYDVIIDGRKVGGAAQRRTKEGFLHQGTISIAKMPDEYLSAVLKPETKVLEAMHHNSFTLIGDNWTVKELTQARQEMKQLITKSFNP
jgi:lipoate-protein ligase A